MKNIIITVLAVLTSVSYGITADPVGAAFLKIGSSARAVGMGSAYTAVSNDVTGMMCNPGGVAKITKPEVALMHTQWLVDTTYDYAAIALPTKIGTLGCNVVYLSQGDLERRGDNRELEGTFGAADIAGSVAFSRELVPGSSLGVNLKLVQQQIENERATGVAVDIGLMHATAIKNLNLGVSIQNLGTQMKFISQGYNLPLTITAGVGYNLFGVVMLASDIKFSPYDSKVGYAIGTEYTVMNMVSLRAGYLMKAISLLKSESNTNTPTLISSQSLEMDTGLSAGLGFKLYNYQFDYSFVPYSDLGNTHRFSLSARF
ncbi:MAG: PorV/PorQ family protein [Elusimicrobiota bacterium]